MSRLNLASFHVGLVWGLCGVKIDLMEREMWNQSQ